MGRFNLFALGFVMATAVQLIPNFLLTGSLSQKLELPPTNGEMITIKTKPVDILLRIQSKDAFYRNNTWSVAAYTYINRIPCVIVIPDEWGIIMRPDRGFANWLSPDSGESLAHEIAHCLYGSWHPAWEKIEAR